MSNELITREVFHEYLGIQYEGNFNMIMEGNTVSQILGISIKDYKYLINNYSKLKEMYGDI